MNRKATHTAAERELAASSDGLRAGVANTTVGLRLLDQPTPPNHESPVSAKISDNGGAEQRHRSIRPRPGGKYRRGLPITPAVELVP